MGWEGLTAPGEETAGHRGWGVKEGAACARQSSLGFAFPGSDFKALRRKRVKMCRSLEVSLALGRPLPGFDEAPSVAGLVINCGHAACSCRCKSSADNFGAYLLMKTPWHFCKHIMANYN